MQASHPRASCTGMAQGNPPEPCIMVIFGVAGDLARRTLLPSLYALYCHQLLPMPFAVIGVARRDWDDQAFRDDMRHHAQSKALFDEAVWQRFAQHLFFVGGDLGTSSMATYSALNDAIAKRRDEFQIPDHVLFHLSTPPALYEEIIKASRQASLLKSDGGWRRVMLEKPFGHNETSARDLDWLLQGALDETRNLSRGSLSGQRNGQNMLAVRFANPGFEPIWNRDYIDHVQITVAEDEGIGSRAGYYDKTGVARDMLQNHLLHLLCITAMEPPSAYDPSAVREETLNVLKAVRPLDVKVDGVFGQYGRGEIDGQSVCAYREEDKVPDTSTTPTFVALQLCVRQLALVRRALFICVPVNACRARPPKLPCSLSPCPAPSFPPRVISPKATG